MLNEVPENDHGGLYGSRSGQLRRRCPHGAGKARVRARRVLCLGFRSGALLAALAPALVGADRLYRADDRGRNRNVGRGRRVGRASSGDGGDRVAGRA